MGFVSAAEYLEIAFIMAGLTLQHALHRRILNTAMCENLRNNKHNQQQIRWVD
jgi:hypothetical protein